MRGSVALCLLGLVALSMGKVIFYEPFHRGWEDSWVLSKAKGSQQGSFRLDHGKHATDKEEEKGLQTTTDEKHYTISAMFDQPFNNADKDLILQYTMRYTKMMDCGGSYIKLLPVMTESEQREFNGDTPYLVMFGPDECGYSEKKTHAIISKNGVHKDNSKSKEYNLHPSSDELTHLYTFWLKPDNTYEIYVDNQRKEGASLSDHYSFSPEPETIRDPKARRPSDWVTQKTMDDPEDVQPADWVLEKEIPDPDDTKPSDWDDAQDGVWKPRMMRNPSYKGKWRPRQIDNPKYVGEWEAPIIPNPAYRENENAYHVLDEPVGGVGIEVWQVKSGVIFDNIGIYDSWHDAQDHAEEIMKRINKEKDADRKIKDKERDEMEARHKKDKEERKKKALENGEDWDEELGRVRRPEDDDMPRPPRPGRDRDRDRDSKKSKEDRRRELEEELKRLEEVEGGNAEENHDGHDHDEL